MIKKFYIRNCENGKYWTSHRKLGWTGEWMESLDEYPSPYLTVEDAEQEVDLILTDKFEPFTTLYPPTFLEVVTVYQKEKL